MLNLFQHLLQPCHLEPAGEIFVVWQILKDISVSLAVNHKKCSNSLSSNPAVWCNSSSIWFKTVSK